LEDAFNVAFHSGGTALAKQGFGTATPPEILSRFQKNYGKPSYQEIKSQQHRRKKRRNNGNNYGGRGGGSPFGVSPNISHHQTVGRGQQYGNQPSYGQSPQRYSHPTGYDQPQQRYGNQASAQPGGRDNGLPYSNAIKQHMDLCYCFSCGYDVDHQGFQCPDPRTNHIPTVKRKAAHTIWGASMKAEHKPYPMGR
jgi:hypothetical protein